MGCDAKTLRKVFSRELAERDLAMTRARMEMLGQLRAQAKDGNVAAAKARVAMLEREQARNISDTMIGRASAAVAKDKAPPKLGKKAEAVEAAKSAEGLFATRAGPRSNALN